jgi:hypothetical protein
MKCGGNQAIHYYFPRSSSTITIRTLGFFVMRYWLFSGNVLKNLFWIVVESALNVVVCSITNCLGLLANRNVFYGF